MSNQHSVIALDWLNPVLQEVFNDLTHMLANRERIAQLPQMVEKLHQVTGALRLINQPELSALCATLEEVSEAIEQGDLSEKYFTDISQSIALLQYGIKQLQQTQQLHKSWITDRTHYLKTVLGEAISDTSTFLDNITLPSPSSSPLATSHESSADSKATADHSAESLVKVWRYNTLQLLESNENNPTYLQPLTSIADYLSMQFLPKSVANTGYANYAKLWQITHYWLADLSQNPQPRPHQYVTVLGELDMAIQDSQLPPQQVASLAVDVLLQGVQLEQKSDTLQQILNPLKLTAVDDNSTMFKQVLAKLEQAIFQMAMPQTALPLLQDIKAMLTNRGWQFYENHLNQIITDIQMMLDDPSSADMLSWQVERQMQDLYTQLLQTTDTLESQVGIAQFAYAKDPKQEAVRQTRIHLENIKLAFNEYVQNRQVDKLLVNDDLTAMSQVFDILGLERPQVLAEQLRVLFGQLVAHGIDTISWETSDTLAEMIAQFELFLDYLSHQNVNDDLLAQTQQLLLRANTLVAEQIQQPLTSGEVVSREKQYLTPTALYDDSGEMLVAGTDEPTSTPVTISTPAPVATEMMMDDITDDSDNLNTLSAVDSQPATTHTIDTANQNSTHQVTFSANPSAGVADSEELQHARSLLKPDDDSMDEDIREIFIEEAEEVLADMSPNLAKWQANPTDLATLKEIRRGFHTLKGSGRMVGAFQVGETAWSIENMLNRVLDNTVPVTSEMVEFIQTTHQQLPTLVADYAAGQSPSIDPAIIILKATNLTQQRPLLQGMPVDTVSTEATVQPTLAEPVNITESLEENVAEAKPSISLASDSVESPVSVTIDNANNVADSDIDTNTNTNIIETDLSNDEMLFSDDVGYEDTHEKQVTAALIPEPTPAHGSATPVAMPVILQQELDSLEWKDDDIMDEDIQEIYVEEAQEVLEEITPLFQQWRNNTADVAMLKEIRRGFHTLKGSGRMVGAYQLGELGWSIENMLNRILDNSIEVDAGVVALIGDVLETFPSLVETFAQSRDDYPTIIRLWAAVANLYSKKQGNNIDYLQLSNAKNTALSAETSPVSVGSPTLSDISSLDTSSAFATPTSPDTIPPDTMSQEIPAHDMSPTGTEVENATAMLSDSEADTETNTNLQEEKGNRFADDGVIPSDDHMIGQVFLEEAQELLQKIDSFIANHQGKSQIAVPDELVRVFHTLRGGAALSELPRVYALSALFEGGLDTLIRQETPLTGEGLVTLGQVHQLLSQYIDDYKQRQSVATLSDDESHHNQLLQTLVAETADTPITHSMNVTQLLALGIDDLLEADIYYPQYIAPVSTQAEVEANAGTEEASVSNPIEAQIDDSAQQYINTLYQQSKILDEAVNDSKFAPLVHALKNAYRYLHQYPSLAQDDSITKALLQTHAQLTNVFDEIAAGLNIYWDDSTPRQLSDILAEKVYQTQLAQIEYEAVDTDNDLVQIFLEEITALEDSFNLSFSQWQNNLTTTHTIKELQRYSNAIMGGARLVGIKSIYQLADATKAVYTAVLDGTLQSNTELIDVMQQVHDTLAAQIRAIKQNGQSFFATELQQQLHSIAQKGELDPDMLLAIPVVVQEIGTEELAEDNLDTAPIVHEPLQLSAEYSQDIINNFEQRRIQTWDGQEPDEDILQIYLEEAKELVDSSSQNLQEFRSNTNNLSALQALQRELHTIKGGARMVGAEGLATLAHEMETVYEELGSRRKPATRMIGNLLAACHDWLASALYVLENKYNPELPQPLVDALLQFSKNPDSLKVVPPASLANQIEQINIYQSSLAAKEEGKKRDLTVMPLQIGNFGETQEQTNISSEMIRVPASLMERMINLSGESAINRARIDMGVSSLTNTIEEMGVTVQRLADQLRRMETELEVQVLSQIDNELLQNADFDPLEMDQYSSLNQLSKSLSESASDLLDIKSTMLDKTRDTENLLLQLSRTQLELQEGLMTSRTVPFSRITPRLQRIVRQTANELNKSVELRILNDDDEIDRNILERITSPLEHMLRNAVDHGIERTQERIESGKSRTGLITLDIEREGDEIVVYLSDDGKGINVDAVRKKAIEQGLIDANDTSLTPVDIMQYIFNAGLSTSSAITQISGRGVGMDVVQSEIKQLGGVVSVDSETGKGSRFILRLPLTVAVSDALIVKAGDKNFAVPLVQIERVVRINAETVYQFYDSNANTIDIDGEAYRLRYLNQILYNTDPRESVRHQTASVPVIIIRNETGQKLALQVDALAGSRVEVVVKPLGRQLSHISGISAATIMGDGSVMLILDLNALMRNAIYSTTTTQHKTSTPARTTKPVVLIIDDSVTVRKVTSRLLERHGYETQVAKDGIDALEKLQDLTPDIMLLDIEMPRMDGFEVATQVRHNSRLKQVPIIMITSRTGEKHRERAISIGVNEYMGKPFQEQELVDTISHLLNVKMIN